ncbi:LysR substrate-binding domain-containing protein [Xinfangfangia sp. CPCC 101601]|uniref:LysR substrate-binding domain-containing protein n=1 Tax=Pseudogemmobacter lacusdianii TaxID=3069608 RepID=A0ABU0VWC0_9RHOB|nr:LysR substrate-binding domain-containing protein [Xinfangfangia sp. CPCC 101601]MDQ2066051.1 LysR substrate-binding domain-containing protein [Xinfangfangia sp. CPCC 101601]
MLINLPYAALRAFEAVVRMGGFSSAAEELGISQSAVSQHVRLLEEWTGQRLLVRGPRASHPTDEGRRLAEAVGEGLGRIGSLCNELRNRSNNAQSLSISCLPGFAINWLFPRLIRFDQAQPDMSVSISTEARAISFAGGEADVAIRYGLGRYSGLYVRRLLGENLTPVCSPELLRSDPDLRCPADLARHTLLVDDLKPAGGRLPNWEFWAAQSNIMLPRPARLRRFGQSNMVVQAAIEGLGVALGRDALVMDALADGRLVRPFTLPPVPSDYAFWFVCPETALDRPAVRAFHDWIFAEATDCDKFN